MKIRTNITIDKEVKKDLKQRAKELGVSVSHLIEKLARKFLRRSK